MSERWARAVLATYRLAGAAGYPVIGNYLARRSGGGDDRTRRRERFGRTSLARPDGPIVWMHAVGEREVSAVLGLAEAIHALGIGIVMTTGTRASAALVAERLQDRVIHQFVPVDIKPAVSRFLDHWRPDLAIMAESEIWPMTVLELGARRVPQVLVNGRMSDRAFAAWSKRHNIAEALLENLALVVAQGERDAERFLSLGARPVVVSGNLKTDLPPPPVDSDLLVSLLRTMGDRPSWCALRAQPQEIEALAQAHKMLKTRHRDLLSVVVPADAAQGDAFEQTFTAQGLVVSRRGRGDKITEKSEILLGDTSGETGLYSRLADVAFVGSSLCGRGGGNPLDPLLCGCAVLSGEDIGYHRDIYEPLIKGGGVRLVKDPAMLAGAVNFLLNNRQACRSMADAGAAAAGHMRGALARTVRELEPFVHPLVVKARLEAAGAARR